MVGAMLAGCRGKGHEYPAPQHISLDFVQQRAPDKCTTVHARYQGGVQSCYWFDGAMVFALTYDDSGNVVRGLQQWRGGLATSARFDSVVGSLRQDYGAPLFCSAERSTAIALWRDGNRSISMAHEPIDLLLTLIEREAPGETARCP